jgi:hypothetical protein
LLHWVAVLRTVRLPTQIEVLGYVLLTIFGLCSSKVLVQSVRFLSTRGSSYVFQKETTREKYYTTATEDSQIEDSDVVTQVDPVEKERKIEATDGYEI